MTNGELLADAEQAGFEVLITVDQNMPNQQSLRGRSIWLLVVRAREEAGQEAYPTARHAGELVVRLGGGSIWDARRTEFGAVSA